MTKKYHHISERISRIYYIGGIALLAFYSLVFSSTILLTENYHSERRLEIVAPYHFKHFEQGQQGKITISPLINIYDDIELLPNALQQELPKDFIGVDHFHLDEFFRDEADIAEYVIYATNVKTPSGDKKVFAVEKVDAVEWDDLEFFLVEVAIFIAGLTVLLIIAGFIVRATSGISEPFIDLANQLENKAEQDFSHISVDEITSVELAQTLSALNNYRARISELMSREKSFTRYISHELRTPMTVVKGSLSVLRKQEQAQTLKQAARIHEAVEQMEQLTQTFLLLARNETNQHAYVEVDDDFIEKLRESLGQKALANQTTLNFDLQQSFKLNAEPLLLFSAVHNIVSNAINSTVDGEVVVKINSQQITVIDTGVGLNEKARGYEGFGVGLLLVKDISDKYHWQFDLSGNNSGKGCKAKLLFG